VSIRTIEVEVIEGQVRPTGGAALPETARGFLTIVEAGAAKPKDGDAAIALNQFLKAPDFPLTPEQFKVSMDADYWDQ
jgi:hypothetical protein